MSDPCPSCGRLPLSDDPEAAAGLLRAIRAEADGRFHTAEAWMRLATVADRVAAVSWLDALLSRPPLAGKGAAFESIRFLVSALAADIQATAVDPDSPRTDAGVVPQPAPALYEAVAEPPRTTIEQLKERLAGILP